MAKFYGPVRRNVHVVLTQLVKQWEPGGVPSPTSGIVEETKPEPRIFNQKKPPKFGSILAHMRKTAVA